MINEGHRPSQDHNSINDPCNSKGLFQHVGWQMASSKAKFTRGFVEGDAIMPFSPDFLIPAVETHLKSVTLKLQNHRWLKHLRSKTLTNFNINKSKDKLLQQDPCDFVSTLYLVFFDKSPFSQ